MSDVMPPDKVFLYPRRPLGEIRAWETLYGFKDFSFPETGFLAHYHGRPHPNKGMAYSAAVEANNIMKRIVIGLAMCLKPTLHPVKNALYQFKRLADYLYAPHYLHTRYYTECSQELMQFIFALLAGVGFGFELSYSFARIPATVLQYENSYRFRFEDIAGMTTKAKLLANPRKELKRIEQIYRQRELSHGENSVGDKFIMIFRLLRLLLLIPSFKKAFRFALLDSNFKNFQPDTIESYWADRFNDYNYGGETRQERQLKQAFKIYV